VFVPQITGGLFDTDLDDTENESTKQLVAHITPALAAAASAFG
jgi:hypothetical protein